MTIQQATEALQAWASQNSFNKKQHSINSSDKNAVVFEKAYGTGIATISIRECNLIADKTNKSDIRFEFLSPQLEHLYFSLRIVFNPTNEVLTAALSLFEAAIKNAE